VPGLTRVTVAGPQRRTDVALPDGVPLAELLPDLLRHAGDGLADAGEQHGGWLLRRVDGAGLPATETLSAAGIRDGEVLHLVAARDGWPELEYDDVVEAVAARARHLGAPWTGTATRLAGIVAAGAVLAAVLAGPAGAAVRGDRWLLGVAGGLLLAGLLAARAYGEPLLGAALATYSLPVAALGGPSLVGGAGLDAAGLVGGCAALTVWSVAAALGAGTGLWIFAAGTTAGLLGSAAGLLATGTGAARAAALLLVAVVVGAAAAPLLAVRLGGLPLPVLTAPTGGEGARPRPTATGLRAAVVRSDHLLSGLLAGLGVAAIGGGWVLADGGVAGPLLVLVTGAALMLRARLFVTVRHRVPLLVSGLVLVLVAAPRGYGAGPAAALDAAAVAVVLVCAVVAVAAAGARYRQRPPSPYLGRAADVIDTLCLVSVIPIAAAVLGLYAQLRGLGG
jgi:type VII secretion integral membrane protein EccD